MRAADYEARIHEALGRQVPTDLASRLRALMQNFDQQTQNTTRVRVEGWAHHAQTIRLGSANRGQGDDGFRFDSGATLSFEVTVKERRLVAFRFHIQFPPGHSPNFLRADLDAVGSGDRDELKHPACHLHPGNPEIRVPFPLTDPLEVLERILQTWDR